MKISDEEKAILGKVGVLALKAYITKTAAETARNAILEELKRLGLRDNGKWQTKKLEGISPFQVATKIGQKLKNQKVFEFVFPGDLSSLLEDLSGQKLAASPFEIEFSR